MIPGLMLDAAGFDVPSATGDGGDASDGSDGADASDAVNCDGGAVCSGACTSLESDANHCGACGRACPAVTGGVPTCSAGVCGFACAAGFERVGAGCEIAAPRQIAPISGAIVASRSPRFSWSPVAGGDASILEICSDAMCAHVLATVESTTSMAASPRVLGPGLWFWRMRGRVGGVAGTRTSPIWEVSVGFEDRPTSATIGYTVDFNRDGLADFVAGAPSADSAVPGEAVVMLGVAGGLPVAGTILHSPRGSLSEFGASTAVGDVNGDGFSDVVMGFATRGATAFGLSVHLGGDRGISDSPDAFIDPPATARSMFGATLAFVGDLNADGYGDVVATDNFAVGTPGGSAYVLLGGAAGLGPVPSVIPSPAPTAHTFGTSLAGIGDADADGFADFVIGAPVDAPTGSLAYIFRGGTDGASSARPVVLADPTLTDATIGQNVARAGDVDGDGFADVLLSRWPSSTTSTEGAVLVVFGGAGPALGSARVTIVPPSTATGLYVTIFAGSIGDVDNDGYSDFALAMAGSDAGNVVWQRGSSTRSFPLGGSGLTRASSRCGGRQVSATGSAGDVDGDRAPDLLVGCSSIRVAGITSPPDLIYLFRSRAGTLDPPVAIPSAVGADNQFGNPLGL